MKILRRVLVGLLGLIAILGIIGLFLPARYSASRSLVIDAPVEVVFDQVVDLRKNEAWSPWMEADPTIKPVYGDKTVGEGASYTWTSESSGDGSLTTVKVVDHTEIRNTLNFGGQPATGIWTFEPVDAKTKVTWAIEGDSGWNIPGRYFGVMMDRLVGPDFERGLRNLARVAEAEAKP